MAEVSPSPGSSLRDPPTSKHDYLYTLAESDPLPTLDLSRSVRSACLSSQAPAKFMALLTKFFATIHLFFFGGISVSILVCFLPAKIARVLAIVALIGIPGTTGALAVLRSDIILLLWTYEFWFFTLTSITSCVLLALHFGDLRALIVPMLIVGTMSSILTDANMAMHRQFVVASVAMLCFFIVLLIYVAFHMVDDAKEFVLLRLNDRSLSAQDALVNGWGTIVVLTIRNIYRKRAALEKHGANSTVMQCINYRCRVKLVRAQSPPSTDSQQHTHQSSVVSRVTTLKVPANSNAVRLTPMRFVELNTVFCARNILVCCAAAAVLGLKRERVLVRLRLLVFGFGLGNLLLSMLSFAIKDSDLVSKVQLGAFGCTLLFCGVCGSMYQRQLLQHLVFSFDFAFLTFQLTFVHLCVCDLVRWDSRRFVIGSSWLWMHWVIMIDALTPKVKHELRLHTRFALLIVALFVVCQIAIAAEILFDPDSKLQDRVVYDTLNSSHSIQFRMIPFLLSRPVSLFAWSLRIQWRLWTLKVREHELVIVQGSVTYNRAKKPAHSKSPRKSLLRLSRRVNIVPTAAPAPM